MDIPEAQKKYFTQQLMLWHRTENNRSLPWKLEKDPYKIWLSEIILQQTRAQQGLPYYLSFLTHFPDVHALADAADDIVFRLWQGLGYYNRCKNLLHTARYISRELDGVFPNTYPQLKNLKGVGDYTAAAIASFAYGLPHAVVDGNVIRVLARFFGIEHPWDTTTGKKYFMQLAGELLDITDSAGYNQGIMDLGATICKPVAPLCEQCMLSDQCFAAKKSLWHLLPVKARKLVVKKRYFHYLIILHNGKIWLQQRTAKDIWQNLYEPYLLENEKVLKPKEIKNKLPFLLKNQELISFGSSLQRLTHQEIHAHFFLISYPHKKLNPIHEQGFWANLNELSQYAFPKTIVSFFKKNNYFEI
jgi:A/G-specific adenine glycosylase